MTHTGMTHIGMNHAGMNHAGRARSAPRSQSGSAYIVTLLALVVLTVLGLVLATVTDVEMEIGANERGITRAFYGADSGVAVGLARVLTSGDYQARTLEVYQDTQQLGGSSGPYRSSGFRLDVSHMVPILVEPCNWCPVNENEQKFMKVNHLVTSTATEVTWDGTDTEIPDTGVSPRAQKTVAVMQEVQPWWEPPTGSIPTDPADLAKIKK